MLGKEKCLHFTVQYSENKYRSCLVDAKFKILSAKHSNV